MRERKSFKFTSESAEWAGATTKWATAQSANKNCAKKTQFSKLAVQRPFDKLRVT